MPQISRLPINQQSSPCYHNFMTITSSQHGEPCWSIRCRERSRSRFSQCIYNRVPSAPLPRREAYAMGERTRKPSTTLFCLIPMLTICNPHFKHSSSGKCGKLVGLNVLSAITTLFLHHSNKQGVNFGLIEKKTKSGSFLGLFRPCPCPVHKLKRRSVHKETEEKNYVSNELL